jgi:histidinol dehydrogenase
MNIIRFPKSSDYASILARPVEDLAGIENKVKPILDAVRSQGDEAVLEFSHKFDGHTLENLKVSEAEIEFAISQVSQELKSAIQTAANNIRLFHLSQKEEINKIETMPGVTCWRKSIPIQKVGLYIPGGTAPLFSTVLMLGIPAQIAGCQEVVLCTPANKNGEINPAILYTAQLLGIKSIFKIGGAQAIAAMAFGTETVSKVYKIFGPGNQYVMAAKQLVTKYGLAIDMPAGPSEVMVIADATANPVFVAADLLSQAEHGADSQVVLVTTDEGIIEAVNKEIEKQTQILPRAEIAKKALANSKIILVKTEDEVLEIVNEYAPEHLILSIANPESLAEKIQNAGSVFLGHYTPESAGDYASGTNHTLPTNGYARAFSGVSLDSFVKKVTFQKISQKGIQNLGPIVELMAENEELHAHKNAVTVRLASL